MLASGLLLGVTAPWGPAIAPDSTSYLNAATSLVREGALRQPYSEWDDARAGAPLTDYAPGFSIVLAAPVAAGVRPRVAARWVEALAAGGTVAIAVELVALFAGLGAAAWAALLLILMPAMTETHLWVLSEPLFILIVAATVAALSLRPDRARTHGLLAAAADLVRFAGIFLVGAVTLWHLLRPGPRRQRLLRACWAAGPGVLLEIWWRLRGIHPGGGISAESFAGLGSALTEGARTLERWLVPGVADGAIRVTLAMALAATIGWVAYRTIRSADQARRPLVLAVALPSACYLGMLLFARLHVVADVPFDDRILGPLLVILTLGLGAVVGWRWRTWGPAARGIAITVTLAWVAGALRHDVAAVSSARAWGLGYESAEWTGSPVSRWLADSAGGRTIYTNDPPGVWGATGRETRLLPSSLDADTVRAFATRFNAAPSLIAGYDETFVPTAPPDSLAHLLGLVPVSHDGHGTVWARTTRR